MNKYVEAYKELIKVYNEKLGLRDCHLLYDYLAIKEELKKENHIMNFTNFDDFLFIRLRYRARERGLIE